MKLLFHEGSLAITYSAQIAPFYTIKLWLYGIPLQDSNCLVCGYAYPKHPIGISEIVYLFFMAKRQWVW
jgi:hypothetical protein